MASTLQQQLAAKKATEEASTTQVGKVETGIQSSTDTVTTAQAPAPQGNEGLTKTDEGIMGDLEKTQNEALEAAKISPEEEALLQKQVEAEEKRQRMLSGFPQDTDLQASAEDEVEAPKGGWKATGIRQIGLENGNWWKAVNGYFVPETEEHERHLEHFLKQGLVEAPADK